MRGDCWRTIGGQTVAPRGDWAGDDPRAIDLIGHDAAHYLAGAITQVPQAPQAHIGGGGGQ